MSEAGMSLKEWIAPSRTALLLIDMQVDFASPEGALGRSGMDMTAPLAAVNKAEGLAEAARKAGVACIFVRLVTREEDETAFLKEWKRRRDSDDPPLCREGTPGADFVGPQPQPRELVISKKRYSAFAGTGLDAALRGEDIDTLVVSGLTTECCIDASVQDAFARDYHVFVVSDATACYQPGLHQQALKALNLNCASVITAAEATGAWI